MTVMNFWTPTVLPLDGLMLVGASAKVGANPIGRFGSGIKFAIAILLRHGAEIKLWLDGEEYEFYLHEKKFRDKEIQTIRMKKRRGIGSWFQSKQLPFTTHMGSAWSLWQAYRELESNTRDEKGYSFESQSFDTGESDCHTSGTLWQIKCPGFIEAVAEAEVFFNDDGVELLVNTPSVKIYNAPSKFLYMEGIRVYETRYPCKLTYNFSNAAVQLTEDRTIGNLWSVLYDLGLLIQREITDENVIRKIVMVPDNAAEGASDNSFEAHELNFYSTNQSSDKFVSVQRYANSIGRAGRSSSTWYATYEAPAPVKPKHTFELSDDQLKLLLSTLAEAANSEANHGNDDACMKIKKLRNVFAKDEEMPF